MSTGEGMNVQIRGGKREVDEGSGKLLTQKFRGESNAMNATAVAHKHHHSIS
jgi:hypothetical protein